MRRLSLTIAWLLTDSCIFVGSYVAAYIIKVGSLVSTDLPFDTYLSVVFLTLPFWLVVMITMRNFALTRRQSSMMNFLYIAYACVIGMAGFALGFYFLKQALFSRLLLLMSGAFSAIAIFLWHQIFNQIQRSMLRSGSPYYPMLIIGTNREAAALVEKLQTKKSPFTPVAILDGKGGSAKELSGVPVLGKLNKLENVIEEHGITHLVQCDQIEHSINLLSVCRNHGIHYMLLPYALGVIDDRVPTEALEGKQVIGVDHRNRSKFAFFFR